MRKLLYVALFLFVATACGGQKAAETEELTTEEQSILVDSIAQETNTRIDSLSNEVDKISSEVDSVLNSIK